MNVVHLHILVDHFAHRFAFGVRGHGKHVAREIIQVNVCQRSQNVGSFAILLGGCGRQEVHGVGQKRAQQKASKVLRNRNLVLTENCRNNGRRTTNNLISERHRTQRREVVDAVMVDNFQHTRLLNCANRLRELVVIHHDNLLVFAIHDVITRSIANQALLGIHHRIYVIAALEHFRGNVFGKLVSLKHHQFIQRRHNLIHRRSAVQVARRVHAAVARNNNGAMVLRSKRHHIIFNAARPHNNKQACTVFDDLALRICVVTNDNNAVANIVTIKVRIGCLRNERHTTIQVLFIVIADDSAVYCFCDILDGRIRQKSSVKIGVTQADRTHVVFRNKTQQAAFFIHHAAIRAILFLHVLHCFKNGRTLPDAHNGIKLYLVHAHARIRQKQRLRKAKTIQQVLRFGV